MSSPKVGNSNPLDVIRNLDTINCGKDAATHFLHDTNYTNLNHGSYGTHPREVQAVQRYYQDRAEARPDAFVRYEYRTELLKEARESIAEYLDVPAECCVYVPNASTGIDIVLHNLNYKPGDVIIGFATTYDSVEYTTQYLSEMTPAEFKKIQYVYPISDQAICDAFEDTVKELVRLGKKPRIAVFDTITSLPAFRMPFESLTEICRSQGVLSLIDGAHGVGMLPLQLRQLDADFFVSNCHKWLYTPRGCGVMYVPTRNQHLLKVTLPTGYGFLPFPKEEDDRRRVPNNFLANFADLGTRDETPYLCVPAALEWRKKLAWQDKRGDEAVMAYLYHLAEQGGSTVAATLGTEVLAQGQSSMTNVRLPLSKDLLAEGVGSKPSEIGKLIMKEMMLKHDTAVNITWYAGALWARLSAQVYLTLEDFETAAVNLKTICEAASERTWTASS